MMVLPPFTPLQENILTKKHINVAKFLTNLKFPIPIMNQIMTMLHKDTKLKPKETGLIWLKKHPETYKAWLKDITTDGKPALPVFEKHLSTL